MKLFTAAKPGRVYKLLYIYDCRFVSITREHYYISIPLNKFKVEEFSMSNPKICNPSINELVNWLKFSSTAQTLFCTSKRISRSTSWVHRLGLDVCTPISSGRFKGKVKSSPTLPAPEAKSWTATAVSMQTHLASVHRITQTIHRIENSNVAVANGIFCLINLARTANGNKSANWIRTLQGNIRVLQIHDYVSPGTRYVPMNDYGVRFYTCSYSCNNNEFCQ